MDRSCFLVKFSNDEDYFKALTGGHWIILDRYLIVHRWDDSFRVSNELPNKLVAWVRFPHLPIQFYHAQILASLGNLICKTVKIKFTTQRENRGKFARIAVEIDLNLPMSPVIELDGCLQPVEYENISTLCFGCGRVGHAKEACPLVMGGVDTLVKLPMNAVEKDSPPATMTPETFGPWMITTRRKRKPFLESNSNMEIAKIGDQKSPPKERGKKSQLGDSPDSPQPNYSKFDCPANAKEGSAVLPVGAATSSDSQAKGAKDSRPAFHEAGPTGSAPLPKSKRNNNKRGRGRGKASSEAQPVSNKKVASTPGKPSGAHDAGGPNVSASPSPGNNSAAPNAERSSPLLVLGSSLRVF
ncbi:hypothetical protein LINPERHAP2_LOCUS3615 [Linum perenne]